MFEKILNADKISYLWCNRFQKHPGVINFFRLVSKTGDGYLYVIFGIMAIFLDAENGLNFFFVGALAYALEVPSFIILKHLFKRHRPFEVMTNAHYSLTPSDKFSLPSGHSAAAFLMATLIAVFYPMFIDIVFVWAILVGISRVMLGVHYPTDIVAGALLGMSCTSIALFILG